MRVDNVTYNKTSLKKRWSQIVKDHKVGDVLVTSNLRFVQGCIKTSVKWKKIGYSVNFSAKIGSILYGPKNKQRSVKGITINALGVKGFVYISQTDIINDLFLDTSEQTRRKKNRADVLSAMRQLINPQIEDFKSTWNKQLMALQESDLFLFNEACKCPISGKNLLTTDIAIDHDIPFIELASEFWRINNIDPFTVLIKGSTFNRGFEDEHLTMAWIEYHRTHALLQAVDATANLKKNKKSTEDYIKSMGDSERFLRESRTALKNNLKTQSL